MPRIIQKFRKLHETKHAFFPECTYDYKTRFNKNNHIGSYLHDIKITIVRKIILVLLSVIYDFFSYIYIYICVCVCVSMIFTFFRKSN